MRWLAHWPDRRPSDGAHAGGSQPVPKLRTSDPATIAQPSTNTKKIVFIMLTGSSDRDLVQKAAALGVNNYLVKPFAPAALKDKIERVFGELS